MWDRKQISRFHLEGRSKPLANVLHASQGHMIIGNRWLPNCKHSVHLQIRTCGGSPCHRVRIVQASKLKIKFNKTILLTIWCNLWLKSTSYRVLRAILIAIVVFVVQCILPLWHRFEELFCHFIIVILFLSLWCKVVSLNLPTRYMEWHVIFCFHVLWHLWNNTWIVLRKKS